MHFYDAFSLKVASSLELPSLLKAQPCEPDIKIVIGKISTPIENANENRVCIQIANVAKYLVEYGQTVVIEPSPNANDDDVRLFLLGSVMGAVLQQRQLLVLHGNAIEIEGQCVAFLGPSGVGKSTLAGAFNKNGCRILADDICAVDLQDNHQAIVVPSFPHIKLWRDTTDLLRHDTQSLSRISNKHDKFAVPLGTGFCTNPLQLRALFVLDVCEEAKIEVQPVRGSEKFSILNTNTYRKHYLITPMQKHWHLTQCSLLASLVPIKKITRPRTPFLLDALMERVMTELESA